MAQQFPVPTIQEVATAGKEIIARVKDGTITNDLGLLNNQVTCGILPYVSTLVLGDPKPIIGKGHPDESLDEVEKKLTEIASKGEAAIPKTGVKDQMIKMLLRVALSAALTKVPEPYKSQIQALIDQFLV